MDTLLALYEGVHLLPISRDATKRCEDGHPAEDKPKSDKPHDQLPTYTHPVSYDQWTLMGAQVVERLRQYITDMTARPSRLPVQPPIKPGYLLSKLPAEAPDTAESFETIMQDFDTHIVPGLLHWQHPCFFGYFQVGQSWPGILADILMSGTCALGFQWVASPAAVELEVLVLDWFVKLLGLPDHFLSSSSTGGGSIQGYASEAILVSILAGKARALEGHPPEDCVKLVAYCSDQAHSCVQKAGMISGIIHFRVLPTCAENEYALQPEVLEAAIKADLEKGLLPFWANATIGTTSSCAVDPVELLGVIAQKYKVYLHVDAAQAGPYAILPELREKYFKGLEVVDSYDTNPHKALLTGIGCSTLYVKDAHWVKHALTITAEYLKPDTIDSIHPLNDSHGHPGSSGNIFGSEDGDANRENLHVLPDFKDWEVSLGTPFRALKLWFVLRMYGAEGLKELMRHRLRMQDYFVQLLSSDSRFTLIKGAPPRFGLVCFKLTNGGNEATEHVLHAVNASGKAFMVHTRLGEDYVIRLAIGGTYTQGEHIKVAFEALQSAVDSMEAQEHALPSLATMRWKLMRSLTETRELVARRIFKFRT